MKQPVLLNKSLGVMVFYTQLLKTMDKLKSTTFQEPSSFSKVLVQTAICRRTVLFTNSHISHDISSSYGQLLVCDKYGINIALAIRSNYCS